MVNKQLHRHFSTPMPKSNKPSISRPDPLLRRFGQRIRDLRQERKWSQEDLAGKTGLHVTYVSGLERGRRNPTLRVIAQLSLALDIDLGDMLARLRSDDR